MKTLPNQAAIRRAKHQYWLINTVFAVALILLLYTVAQRVLMEYQAWQQPLAPTTPAQPAQQPTSAAPAPRIVNQDAPVQAVAPPVTIEQPAPAQRAEPSAPNLPVATTSVEMIVDGQFVPAPPEPTLVPGSAGGGGSSGGSTWGTP